MDLRRTIEAACHNLTWLVHELVRVRSLGHISEAEFVATLLRFEAAHVAPHGYSLTASNTLDNWTVLKLRIDGTCEPCVVFEFLPETGEFRAPGTGPVQFTA